MIKRGLCGIRQKGAILKSFVSTMRRKNYFWRQFLCLMLLLTCFKWTRHWCIISWPGQRTWPPTVLIWTRVSWPFGPRFTPSPSKPTCKHEQNCWNSVENEYRDGDYCDCEGEIITMIASRLKKWWQDDEDDASNTPAAFIIDCDQELPAMIVDYDCTNALDDWPLR